MTTEGKPCKVPFPPLLGPKFCKRELSQGALPTYLYNIKIKV